MKFVAYYWYENSLEIFFSIRDEGMLDTYAFSKPEWFQVSVSAEIHTFPCFSWVVVQAQETLSSAYAKLCMTRLCYLNFTTLYLLEW